MQLKTTLTIAALSGAATAVVTVPTTVSLSSPRTTITGDGAVVSGMTVVVVNPADVWIIDSKGNSNEFQGNADITYNGVTIIGGVIQNGDQATTASSRPTSTGPVATSEIITTTSQAKSTSVASATKSASASSGRSSASVSSDESSTTSSTQTDAEASSTSAASTSASPTTQAGAAMGAFGGVEMIAWAGVGAVAAAIANY